MTDQQPSSKRRTPSQETLFMLGQLFSTTQSIEEKITDHLITSKNYWIIQDQRWIAQDTRWENFIKWQVGVDNRLKMSEDGISHNKGRLDIIERIDVRSIIKEELEKVEVIKKDNNKDDDDKDGGNTNTITFKWIVEKVVLVIAIPVVLYLFLTILPAVIKNLP
jgi:hypothetical protein